MTREEENGLMATGSTRAVSVAAEALGGGQRRLRMGVLSTADIALKKVIPGMRSSALVEVVAIASRQAGRAEAVAGELAIARAHGSYEALLADPDVDAVYIPLPNHLHAEWTIAALRAGKPVLCEKPIALTADEAQGMVDVARETGVPLMEAFMYRQHPSWVAVRELVASGRIGRLRAVDRIPQRSVVMCPPSPEVPAAGASLDTHSADVRVCHTF